MSARGEETRERIVDAALDTVREEGFADTTARAIARRGGFNPALIFYHFGSIEALLFEAFGRVSSRNVDRYREAVADVASLRDLVGVARRLHAEDLEDGSISAVTHLMAAAHDPQRGGELLDRFDEWIRLVEQALRQVSSSTPAAAAVPTREAAYSMACMFLGIELLSRLDPSRSEADAVFDMLDSIATLIEQVAPALVAAWSPPA